VLVHDVRQDISAMQQEDLASFGRLLIVLCCNNISACTTLPKSLEVFSKHYSSELKNLALYLFTSKPGPHKVRGQCLYFTPMLTIVFKNVGQILDMISGHLFAEIDEAFKFVSFTYIHI
jgi:PAB-dependent poly(A)-specific ribonuclease subunit 3